MSESQYLPSKVDSNKKHPVVLCKNRCLLKWQLRLKNLYQLELLIYKVCVLNWGKASAELFRGCGRSCHLSDYINVLML